MLCATPDAAASHTEALLDQNISKVDDGVLIEAFVAGLEYSVELFNGCSVGVTRKHLGPPPFFVEVGHDFPAPGPESLQLARYAERAAAALGHVGGPGHVEIKLGTPIPCIVEINPRLAGGMIPELVRRATGIDLITMSIKFACGMTCDFSRSCDSSAAIRFLLRSARSPVHNIEGLEVARRMSGVVEAELMPAGLGRDGPIRDFRDRIAYVIAEASAPDDPGPIADRALSVLRPRLG